MATIDTTRARASHHVWRRAASCLLALTLAQFALVETARGQRQGRGQTAPPPAAPAEPASTQGPPERVRVPTSYANVHLGPSSGNEVLVLVPKGTILTVLGRDKEWIQVRLTPEFRKTGMVMRWYKNEDKGWMHDSTVEIVKPEARPAIPR